MAGPVEFQAWQCHDDRPALAQEDAIKRVLGFAMVHDFSVTSDISQAFTAGELSGLGWEGQEGTWALSGGKLQGTGGGAASTWYKIRHETEISLGFVATFNKDNDRGAFLFCSDDSYNGYLVWWTATTIGLSSIAGATETVLVNLPIAGAGAAAVTVAVWPLRYTKIDEVDDLAVVLWFNDRLMFTHVMEYVEKGSKVGFAVYESDVITFDNLRVPQLHQIVEWTSVDPGEPASAGLSRIIAYELIRVQARYDGSVKMWRNTGTDVDWTVPVGRVLGSTRTVALFWPRHLRLVGAQHEIDHFRPGNQGHIFSVGSDPNALGEEETHDRAVRRHKTVEEGAGTKHCVMAPNPLLEPEDVISESGSSWRVTSIDYRVAWVGSGESAAPVLQSSIEVRKCLP